MISQLQVVDVMSEPVNRLFETTDIERLLAGDHVLTPSRK